MKVPKTLEEARINSAPLWRGVFKEISAQGLADGQPAQATEGRRGIEKYARGCYSLPWLRKEMKAWMIDFCWGDENPFCDKKDDGCDLTQEQAKELINLLIVNTDRFAEKLGGGVMKEVTKFLSANGFQYTDAGGGGCGGHVGVPCTDDEMDRLITLAHERFGKLIERGLLMVKVAWFKPKLFTNDDEARSWLHARGLY